MRYAPGIKRRITKDGKTPQPLPIAGENVSDHSVKKEGEYPSPAKADLEKGGLSSEKQNEIRL